MPYVLDASASEVAFHGRALFQTIDGRTADLDGLVTIVDRDIRSLRGAIRFPVASLDVEPTIPRRELESLFGGGPRAEIIFLVDSLTRTATKGFYLHGRLTMNGVTRPVAFLGEARYLTGRRIEARGSARVDIRDWGIHPPKRFFGLVSMHHELTLSFDATFAPRVLARGGDVALRPGRTKDR
ncbi:MAG: YceI family protein [Gemmatimonadaceae bacterium]